MYIFYIIMSIAYILYGFAGMIIRIFNINAYSFSLSRLQYYLYTDGVFDDNKYGILIAGFAAANWWKILLSGLLLGFIGFLLKKYRPVLKATSKKELTGLSQFLYIASLIIVPILTTIFVSSLHIRILHGIGNPFSYIASFGIFGIPWGENYVYYNSLSIIILNLAFSIYFMLLWGNILKIHRRVRRFPRSFFWVACYIASLISVLTIYPLISICLPIVVLICIMLYFGADSGEKTEEEKKEARIHKAGAYVAATGSTLGLEPEDIKLLQNAAMNGDLPFFGVSDRENLMKSMENSNSSHTTDDEILYWHLQR